LLGRPSLASVRQALVEKLKRSLAREGEQGLMANRGFARFLKAVKGGVSLDEAALAADARLDGKFVLTTNTEIPADQVVLTYKSRRVWGAHCAPFSYRRDACATESEFLVFSTRNCLQPY
jgi:hypothetical protein